MNQVHALQTISETGSRPMTKATIPAEGTDARMQGSTLCAEVMAAIKGPAPWRGFAIRIINMTVDARSAFLKAMKAELTDLRKRNSEAIANLAKDGTPDPSKEDTKLARQRVASATVEASKLQTIAVAFNGAATVEGLIEHAASTGRVKGSTITLDQVGYEVIVEYSRQFRESTAGRKADPFIVKVGKWLDQNKPNDDADNATQAQYAAFVALHTKLAKAT